MSELVVMAGLAGEELKRREGWEGRLAAVIEFARDKPYQLGEHDCFRIACAAVEALTGIEAWSRFRGRYKTKRQALAFMARYASSFTEAFSLFFGSQPVPIAQARRGDIVEYRDDAGEAHLGVAIGGSVAVLGEDGLRFVRRSICAHAWRIG